MMTEEFKERITNYYAGNYGMLVKKFSRRAGGPIHAEDVVQEAFTLAMTYWRSYNPERSFGAWMNRVALNALYKHLKDTRNAGATNADEEILEILAEEPEHLDEEIARLIGNNSDRKILTLYFSGDYRPRDLAHLLDMKVGTVDQVIHRFKKSVREKLTRENKQRQV